MRSGDPYFKDGRNDDKTWVQFEPSFSRTEAALRSLTHRGHDAGRDGGVPLVLVGETEVGVQLPADPDRDADYHGRHL